MSTKRQPGERARAVALKNLAPLINELHDLSQDLTLDAETQTPEQLVAVAGDRACGAGVATSPVGSRGGATGG